jgi:phosphatidylserine/phosphatidylglycerophosphate/cardiolipin synthase-like enzyme
MRKLIVVLCLISAPLAAETIGNDTVCFVPGPDDCAMVAVDEIGSARQSVSMQSYGFTEPHIAQALIDAKARGVSVRLIVDKTAVNERNGETQVVAQAGIPVWVDYHPRIAHNKVIVVDSQSVETGSLNWTNAADHANAENTLVVHDPALAQAYERNFESRLAASETLAEYEDAQQR